MALLNDPNRVCGNCIHFMAVWLEGECEMAGKAANASFGFRKNSIPVGVRQAGCSLFMDSEEVDREASCHYTPNWDDMPTHLVGRV